MDFYFIIKDPRAKLNALNIISNVSNESSARSNFAIDKYNSLKLFV
jgi:hypothetical protein